MAEAPSLHQLGLDSSTEYVSRLHVHTHIRYLILLKMKFGKEHGPLLLEVLPSQH